MKKSIAILSVGGFMLSVLHATTGAQAPASVNTGVYSTAQAMRGEAVYKDNCAACHGDDLRGSGPMPALAGPEFVANYKTLGDLFEKVQTTMPATAPGSMTDAQTSDVLAYMLSVSKYPAGASDMPATKDALSQIALQAPAAGGAAPAAGATPAAGAAAAPAAGGGAASVKAGVYTDAQAKRGEALYKDNCAACHGDDLAGSGPMPPLAGADFLANWKNVGDLFEKTHSSMPASAPGSLSEQQTADILAFMLQKSNFPAGQTELPATQDALTPIVIEK